MLVYSYLKKFLRAHKIPLQEIPGFVQWVTVQIIENSKGIVF